MSAARQRSLVQLAFRLDAQRLGARVVSGAAYKFLGIALRTLITLGSTAWLARLLVPADFGYVAMATVITELAAMLGALGLGNVLIQRPVITRLQLDTVFWASLALGGVLALLVLALSFGAGWLFADAQVRPLLRALSVTFIFNSLSVVPGVVLSRLLRFNTEFWANMAVVALRALAAVLCALAGWGVWSLVAGALVGTLAGVLVSFACVPYWPRLRFEAALLRQNWRTSGGYFGSGLLYYLNTNLDLLLIGRQLGATPLGYYQNARALTDEIRGRIAMPIQQVLFPAFSAAQSEPERVRQLVLRAGSLLAALVIPVGVGVSANAPELVLVLYGEQWRAMTGVMSLFGISAALRAATALAAPLFNACNRVGLAFRYNLISSTLMVGAVLWAMPYGVERVAQAVMLTSLYALVSFRAGLALIGLRSRHIVQILGAPALAASVMWLLTLGLREMALPWHGPLSLQLAWQVGAGALVYLATLHALSRSYWQALRALVLTLAQRRPATPAPTPVSGG